MLRALCYFYFPPCGNITHFEPPAALCGSICQYMADSLCQKQWTNTVLRYYDIFQAEFTRYNFGQLNCSNPSSELDAFPHCCSDAGIEEFMGIYRYIYHCYYICIQGMSSLHSLIPFTPAKTSTHAGINNCTPQLYLGLCCMHDVGSSCSCNYFLGQIAARGAAGSRYMRTWTSWLIM